MSHETDKPRSALASLLSEVSLGERALILGGMLIAGVAEGVGLAALLPLLNLIDAGQSEAGGKPVSGAVAKAFGAFGLTPTLVTVLTVIVVVITLKSSFMLLTTRYGGYAVARLDAEFRIRLINSWMKARWDFFVRQPAGAFVNAIGTECTRAAAAFQSVMMMIADAIQVIVYLVAALFISPYITLAAICCGGAIVLAFGRLVRASRKAGERQTQLQRAITTRLSDGLLGMKPIKAMGREDYLAPLLRLEIDELCAALKKQMFVAQVLKTQYEPIVAVVLACGFFAAVTLFKLDLAVIILLGFLFMRSVNYMLNLQKRYQNYVSQESAYKAILELERLGDSAREDVPASRRLPTLERGIEFDRLVFAYGDRGALHEVTVALPAHALIVLTGHSGAGKTTFVDLLAGLHRPKSGQIRVDGVSLDNIDLFAWRKMIGYVPQEMFLFHDSICANIAMGDPEISREQVCEALEATGLWEFVQSLDEGLDTIVGERGSKLSGGQRQRVSLARALVGRPRLLILDEVTASLDPEAEASLVGMLKGLRGRLSIIAITHQSRLVEDADVLLRVENHHVQIVPRGLANDRLVMSQCGGEELAP